MAAPSLATQAAKAGDYPNEFNKREARLLQSVKTYVDAQTGGAAVITTQGDLIIGDALGDPARLARGTSGQVLVANGTTAAWASIGLASLAAGITPSHIVKYAGTFTTAGGDASEAITVAGAVASDIVTVTVKTAGATPRSIVASTAATNAINVTLSGDPSTDHVLQYCVFRAAS